MFNVKIYNKGELFFIENYTTTLKNSIISINDTHYCDSGDVKDCKNIIQIINFNELEKINGSIVSEIMKKENNTQLIKYTEIPLNVNLVTATIQPILSPTNLFTISHYFSKSNLFNPSNLFTKSIHFLHTNQYILSQTISNNTSLVWLWILISVLSVIIIVLIIIYWKYIQNKMNEYNDYDYDYNGVNVNMNVDNLIKLINTPEVSSISSELTTSDDEFSSD
jgi:hypothetical protein